MRKIVILVFIALFSNSVINAEDSKDIHDLFEFRVGKESATIMVKDKSMAGKIVIPDFVEIDGNTYPVKEIPSNAFSQCDNITEIVIPKTVGVIWPQAFWCKNIQKITVDKENPWHKDIDGVLYRQDGKTLESYPCGRGDEEFVIPDGVEIIEKSAFYHSESLKTISIPSSVMSIGNDAFFGCSSLETVNMNLFYPLDLELSTIGLHKSYLPNLVLFVPKGSIEYYQNKGDWWYNVTIQEKDMGAVDMSPFIFSVVNEQEASVKARSTSIGGVIEIPEKAEIDGKEYTITRILRDAFNNCKQIKEVIFPKSLNVIETSAFYECNALSSVTLKTTYPLAFGFGAFPSSRNDAMTIYVPKGSSDKYKATKYWSDFHDIQEKVMEDIDNDPFVYTIIDDARVSVGAKYKNIIGRYEIPETVKIEDVVYSVTKISTSAFWNCSYVTGITIPQSVIWIENNVISGCSSLSSIILKDFWGSAGMVSNAFIGVNLDNITLCVPTGSLDIYLNHDEWCKFKNIQEMDMEGIDKVPLIYTIDNDKVTITTRSKAEYVIKGKFEVPESVSITGKTYLVTDIDFDAFEYCDKLTELCIPKTITSMPTKFNGCVQLEKISVAEGNEIYKSVDGVLFSADGANLLAYPCAKADEEYEIPKGVRSVYEESFFHNKKLKVVRIPSSVRNVWSSFNGCDNLYSILVNEDSRYFKSDDGILFSYDGMALLVYPCGKTQEEYTIPQGVTSVSIRGNEYLKSLIIPEGVTSLYLSQDNSLQSLIIPGSIKLFNDIFRCSESLSEVTIRQFLPGLLNESYLTDEILNRVTLYVPTGSLKNYRNQDPWRKFVNIQEIDMEGVSVSMFEYTILYDEYTLTKLDEVVVNPINNGIMGKVTIPEKVEIEGESYTVSRMGYFGDCHQITEISIPKTICSYNGGLGKCKKLEKIVVDPESNFFMEKDGVLYNAAGTRLYEYLATKTDEEFEIPMGVDSIASISNEYLKKIVLPSSLRVMGGFFNSTSLTSIVVRWVSPKDYWFSGTVFAEDTYRNAKLFVPKGSLAVYRKSVIWRRFAHIVEIEMPDVDYSSSPFANPSENQLLLGYYTSDEIDKISGPYAVRGGVNAGLYKYCIGFDKDDIAPFVGSQIIGVRFVLDDTDISDVRIWIASSRMSESIYEQSVASLVEGWNEVMLEKPFDIMSDSIFIGVMCQQKEYKYPIKIVPYWAEKGSCYIYGPYDNGKYVWEEDDTCLSFQCLLEGNNLPAYYLRPYEFSQAYNPAEKYYKGEINASMSFKNWGTEIVDDFSVDCFIDDSYVKTLENIYSSIGSANQFGLGGLGGNITFPKNLKAGKHTLTYTIKSVNGNEIPKTVNTSMSFWFRSYTESMKRQKSLVQLYTGTWCLNSPRVKDEVEALLMDEDNVLVSSHINDELTCEAGKTYNIFAGHYPQMSTDRFAWDDDRPGIIELSPSIAMSHPSFADVNISASYYDATRMLTVKVTGKKNEDFDAVIGSTNLTVLLTENNVVCPQMHYQLGVDENYVHQGVLRTNVSAIWGDPVTWNGEQYEMSYTIKLDESWVKDNMNIVAFLGKPFTGDNYYDIHLVNCNDFAVKDAVLEDIPTSLITIGKSGKASYCGDLSLDFSFSDEVKAYIATGFDKDEGTIWLTRVKDVPAGVPVLIKGDANKTYNVPVTDSQNSYYTNMFVGNTTGEKMVIQERDGDMVNYYLSGDGTFKSVNKTANIGTNKCYLQLPGTFEAAATGATQTVKVGSIGKASFAAPVDLDFTNVSGLKAFTATGYDKSTKTIWLTRVMKVQKGEGVLLKGDPNSYEIPSAAVQSSYENMFVGNTSGDEIRVQETSEDGSQTNYYLSGKDGSFVSVNGFAKIGNNKCYLALPTSMVAVSSTRSAEDDYKFEEPEVIKLPIDFKSIGSEGGGTTSIREVKSGEVKSDEWFTLQGQRIAKPGKGIYIHNGHKVVIK